MKLSICIPTYNFGRFIGETLESIIPQLTDDVEILILDGGSTDNTPQVVEAYQARCTNIRYSREAKRGGIDHDMHLSVQKARGEYCWLFSADDWMREGALVRILKEIEEGCDVYVCGFTICSLDMSQVIEEHRFSKILEPKVFNLSEENERQAYFASAIATPAFFSFMSSLIVKRKRWLEVDIDHSFFGSCWAHAARIFHMIPNGLRVKHLPASFLQKRAFNDSFMDKGYIHRISIAIDGYHDLADRIFGFGSLEAFHIRQTLRNEFPAKAYLFARIQVEKMQDLRKLFLLILKTYTEQRLKGWLIALFVLAMPKSFLRMTRYVIHKMKRGDRNIVG